MNDLAEWHRLKMQLVKKKRPSFEERQVWWASIGINVGDEENGKSKYFTRPVIVLRKFNHHLFIGVPMTTRNKDNPYYSQVNFKGIEQSAMISQICRMDAKRLRNQMGRLSQKDFLIVREAVKGML